MMKTFAALACRDAMRGRKMLLMMVVWMAASGTALAGELPAIAELLQPYRGERASGVDVSTLTGKVMCGYQGWFTTGSDGSAFPWNHWTTDRKIPSPSNIRVDLWPDMSEYGPEERYETAFFDAQKRPAVLFSSLQERTVDRHFSWMRAYGIDGAFVQRFATGLPDPRMFRVRTTVLSHCRKAANQHGRSYAVMYDLSGLKRGATAQVMDDWRKLSKQMQITGDASYQRHRGKPLVAVWGIGFSDKREYTLEECRVLLEFFREQGCALMIGVPTRWRELRADAVNDPKLLEVVALADIVSPWTVGRYGNDAEAHRHGETMQNDIAWCAQKNVDYLPVVFPGFSWHNMKPEAKFDAIPRRGGQFLWTQCVTAKKSGAGMLYVAMFDEVDEGTAIFKCDPHPPQMEGRRFVCEPHLPSDHYLKVTGAAALLLQGKISGVEAVDEALRRAAALRK
jgi:hypothetical protein